MYTMLCYILEVTVKSLLYDEIYINGEIDSVEDLSFGSGTTVIIEAEVSLKGCFLFCVHFIRPVVQQGLFSIETLQGAGAKLSTATPT